MHYPTTWECEPTWFSFADWARQHTCRERQYFDKCSCLSGRKNNKYNPCDKGIAVSEAATAIATGQDTDLSIEDMMKWVKIKMCAGGRTGQVCKHRGCDKAAHFLNWLGQHEGVLV